MAKGKKTGGRNFQKGVQNYFSQLTDEDKALRKLSRESFKTIVARNFMKTLAELEEIVDENDRNSTVPAGELLVINVLISAIKTKDEKKMEALLLRSIGKTREVVSEDRRVTIKITDQHGQEITMNQMEKMDNQSLKQIVDSMLKVESVGSEN